MYFLDALKVLVRRWYVVVAGFLLMALAAAAAINWVPTSHQASGQVLFLLPPEATGSQTPTSPFLNLPEGLSIAASLVASNVTTKDTARDMESDGFDSDYAIALNPGGGPLLVITTKDTDPAAAMATRDELIGRVAAELERLQSDAGVPQRQWIYPTMNALGQRAEALPGNKIRALAAILGTGLALTLTAAFVLDRPRTRRGAALRREEGAHLHVAAARDRKPKPATQTCLSRPPKGQVPRVSRG